MSEPKKLLPLPKVDAAYIAGLIDGEGTVTLTRKHKNEYRQLCISISSTEKYLLKYVLDTTGVGKITNKKTSLAKHSASFAYAVYNRQALRLLHKVAPYLKTYKKKRADLILNNYLNLTPRNGKYNETLLAKKHCFEANLLAIKANT